MDCCHVGKQKVVDLVNQKRMTWTVRDLLVGVAGKMRKRFIALTKTASLTSVNIMCFFSFLVLCFVIFNSHVTSSLAHVISIILFKNSV